MPRSQHAPDPRTRAPRILTAALLAGAAALTAALPAQAGNNREPPLSGQITVIGLSDLALCVLETQRDAIGDAFYWCDRTIRRGESSIQGRSVALMHRGVLRLKTHDVEAAMKDIDAAIALTPVFGDAYFNRGNALFALGRFDEAIGAYATALEQGCTTPELVHYNRARALQRLGREQEAQVDLAAARTIMPEDSPLVSRLDR